MFAHALTATMGRRSERPGEFGDAHRGIAVWIMNRLRRRVHTQPRLAVIERVTLAPRQVLALVEAEGQRLLVGTSQDGTPVFYPLDSSKNSRPRSRRGKTMAEGPAA